MNPPVTERPALDSRAFLKASFVLHTVFLALRFTYMWLDDVTRDDLGTGLERFIEEGTGAYGGFMLSWFVFALWRRMPLRGANAWRRLLPYLALGVTLSVANTAWMWGSRSAIFPLLGMGPYDYGRMPLRFLMELPQSLIGFSMIVSLLALSDALRERGARAAREAALERALVESQLQGLRLRLQPHFLFNALNTIAARVHDDPALADQLISRLSDLLRASLQASDEREVPLKEELALLGDYVALMEARFGERLTVRVDVEQGLSDVAVPPLLLQPLVENAVRHGSLERSGRAQVSVRVARTNGDGRERLTVRVHDDGPGVSAGRDPLTSGTGLSATARRIALLHGDAATIAAANAVGGGFAVDVVLPVRRA